MNTEYMVGGVYNDSSNEDISDNCTPIQICDMRTGLIETRYPQSYESSGKLRDVQYQDNSSVFFNEQGE